MEAHIDWTVALIHAGAQPLPPGTARRAQLLLVRLAGVDELAG